MSERTQTVVKTFRVEEKFSDAEVERIIKNYISEKEKVKISDVDISWDISSNGLFRGIQSTIIKVEKVK